MNKILIVLLLIVSCALALDKSTKPYTFTAGTAAKASEVNANYDTLYFKLNMVIDSTIRSILHFSADVNSHDSIVKFMRVDSIRSNPDIDSIKGTNVIRGNPDIDSISGSPKINAATVLGTLSVDSLISTKMINANLKGNVTGTADSAKSAHHLSGGAVSATTGLFSSNLSADSIYSTKGIKGLRFVGAVTGDLTGTADSSKKSHHSILADSTSKVTTNSAIVVGSIKSKAYAFDSSTVVLGSDGWAQGFSGAFVRLDTYGGASLDTCSTFTPTSNEPRMYIISIKSSSRAILMKKGGSGVNAFASDFLMNDVKSRMLLFYDPDAGMCEISRSTNN
jgi:hypothetical protein